MNIVDALILLILMSCGINILQFLVFLILLDQIKALHTIANAWEEASDEWWKAYLRVWKAYLRVT